MMSAFTTECEVQLAKVASCTVAAKVAQICAQFVPNTSEDCETLVIGSHSRTRWIFKAVMQPICRTKENRAGFAGIVTDRYNVIEPLSLELADVL